MFSIYLEVKCNCRIMLSKDKNFSYFPLHIKNSCGEFEFENLLKIWVNKSVVNLVKGEL